MPPKIYKKLPPKYKNDCIITTYHWSPEHQQKNWNKFSRFTYTVLMKQYLFSIAIYHHCHMLKKHGVEDNWWQLNDTWINYNKRTGFTINWVRSTTYKDSLGTLSNWVQRFKNIFINIFIQCFWNIFSSKYVIRNNYCTVPSTI